MDNLITQLTFADDILNLVFLILSRFAFIALAAIGLAIIFGTMGVINLAHGEFVLIGMYATTLSVNKLGIPFVASVLIGTLATTIFGVMIERVLIRHLYNRLLDSMVVTWGVGLIISQLLLILFGSTIQGVGLPFGAISYGKYSTVVYRSIVLPVVLIGMLVFIYLLFTRTTFGMKARATIDDPETAEAMGVDTTRVYLLTFALGSAITGAAGGLAAPLLAVTPETGSIFLAEAFIAVVIGGSSVLIGTVSAAGLLGVIDGIFRTAYGAFLGRVSLLCVAILAIRFLPSGISGYINTIRQRRKEKSQ